MNPENILFGNVALTFGVGFITWIIIGGFAYLRCTIKKSCNVLWKVLKYGAYLIGAILAAVFAFYGARAIYELVVPGLTNIWQFMIGVPWYYYAGLAGIAAIPVYSLLWCIARDLTEEDWKSNAAENFALALALAFALALALLVAAFLAAAFALALAAALAATLALAVANHTSIWYYIFRFFGAAYHHYKVRKSTQPS